MRKGVSPYFTQTGEDREDNPPVHSEQSYAGFRWFDIEGLETISVEVKTKGHGKILVGTSPRRTDVCSIDVSKSKKWTSFEAKAHVENGVEGLYFTWTGTGGLDFNSFTLNV